MTRMMLRPGDDELRVETYKDGLCCKFCGFDLIEKTIKRVFRAPTTPWSVLQVRERERESFLERT